MKPDRAILTSQYTLLPVKDSKQPWYKKVSDTLALYRRNHRTRKQLAKLTIDQLDDIGLTIEQVEREAKKPFWVI